MDGGDKFIGGTKTLTGNSHTFKLGGFDQLLKYDTGKIIACYANES